MVQHGKLLTRREGTQGTDAMDKGSAAQPYALQGVILSERSALSPGHDFPRAAPTALEPSPFYSAVLRLPLSIIPYVFVYYLLPLPHTNI